MTSRVQWRLWLVSLAAATWGAGALPAPAASASTSGDAGRAPIFSAPRISYDRQCFTIDGKDVFNFSAAFHYFRCPKPLWADRFARLKAAGFNTVETYVPWNWHEQSPPANPEDFSKLQDMDDLRDWLTMATQQFGFNVLLRPGPYICAEWDGGGYPQWLTTKKPAGFKGMWFRGADPTYLAWCKHWYTAVARVAAPFQITRQPAGKPGIILWQLENEYNYDANHPPEEHRQQLLALGHDARDLGIDVPFFTCQTTGPLLRADPFLKANVLETLNAYPKYDMKGFAHDLDGLGNYQPERLRAMSELQGGWFSDVGGRLSAAQGFSADQIQHITLLAWAHGFTSTNYYMGFGGTNFGGWAARGITTTYDYDAPVHEDGGVGPRYAAVAGMGQFLANHAAQLVRAVDVPIELTGAPPHVSARLRRSPGGSQFLFLFNDAKSEPARGSLTVDSPGNDAIHLTVSFDLAPFQAKIFFLPDGVTDAAQGQWFPTRGALPQRPASLPASIRITSVRTRIDPGPSQWQPLALHASEESVGIDDRRFVYFRTTVPAAQLKHSAALLLVPDAHDRAVVLFNGERLQPGPASWAQSTYALPAQSGATTDATLSVLYENPGRPNGGDEMEQSGGPRTLAVVSPASLDKPLVDWHTRTLNDNDYAAAQSAGSAVDETTPTGDSFDINGGASDLHKTCVAIYRCTFDYTPEDQAACRTQLYVGRIDDRGTVYLNGQKVAESSDFSKPVRAEVASALRPGHNVLSIVVQNENGWGGLGRGASLERASAESAEAQDPQPAWRISGEPLGRSEHWEAPQLKETDWSPLLPGNDPSTSQADTSLRWYRLHFPTPAEDPHVWTAWHLHLDAAGNGFLYLNGHPLGRWWQVGPQHDYFLPSCWMNPTGDNVIALCLRPTETVELKRASIDPDADTAEAR